MKTTRLLFLGILGIFSSLVNLQAQTQTGYANANVTSFGSLAGVTTVSTSGSSFYGYQAGKFATASTANAKNSFFGASAGLNIAGGTLNTFLGFGAGVNTSSSANAYVGVSTGQYNIGTGNVAFGNSALSQASGATVACNYNVALGNNSGQIATGGSNNVFVGASSGTFANGSNNTLLGAGAGEGTSPAGGGAIGTGNVLIGYQVGRYQGLSDKLFIDNTATSTPLIWGDFTPASRQVKLNGKVGVGTVGTFPATAGSVNVGAYRLFVTGGILTEEVRILLTSSGGNTWADYVFAKDYDLKPLSEVEKFIQEKGHLPNVPSAAQIKEEGIAVSEMAKIQQEKIEELTLYIIAQNKMILELSDRLTAIEKR
ncbi:hypothetical protein [Flavobacterium sp.]|uniref:hypothetical protein n=1 Tax=Flavobacterium sp. TaxID=239 RepID=UPI00286CD669|nr:hypothetical protein [Flavobacterium sp.]